MPLRNSKENSGELCHISAELNWFRDTGITIIAKTAQSRKKVVLNYVYNVGPRVPPFYPRAINVAYSTL